MCLFLDRKIRGGEIVFLLDCYLQSFKTSNCFIYVRWLERSLRQKGRLQNSTTEWSKCKERMWWWQRRECGGGHSHGGRQSPFTEPSTPGAHTGVCAGSPRDPPSTLPLGTAYTGTYTGHLPVLLLLLRFLFQRCIQLFENSTPDGRIEQNRSFMPVYLPLSSWCRSWLSGTRSLWFLV